MCLSCQADSCAWPMNRAAEIRSRRVCEHGRPPHSPPTACRWCCAPAETARRPAWFDPCFSFFAKNPCLDSVHQRGWIFWCGGLAWLCFFFSAVKPLLVTLRGANVSLESFECR
ncbi:unnamed protein product [Discosporangium mesarthrocarpum]